MRWVLCFLLPSLCFAVYYTCFFMFLTFYMIHGTVKIVLLSQFWLFTSICVKKVLSLFLCCPFLVKWPSNNCQRIKSSISDLFFAKYEVFCTSWKKLLSYFVCQILLTVAEHHSAIVPWQFVSQKTGATLKYVGLTKEEVPDIEQLKGLLSNKTKIVVVHHVSNVLGKLIFYLEGT